ncbi:MAG TPA: hypothetical protein ENJ88_00820 [Phaeodactylibacter sp.]|nr:hypothetical protein [Phaeodactylibacter sp.]
MEILKEMVGLHSRERTSFRLIFGVSKSRANSKEAKLYDAILHQKVHTDEQAIRFLYPEAEGVYDRAVRKLYSNLKKRLEEKLLDAILKIKKDGLSDEETNFYHRAIFEVNRLYAIANTLNPLGLARTTITVARKGLRKAEKAGFLVLAINFCEILIRRHAFLGEKRKMLHYREVREQLEEQWKVERMLGDEITMLAAFFSHAQGISDEAVVHLGEKIEKLKAMREERKFSFMSLYRLHHIESIYLQLIAAHEKNIALSDAWIREMRKYPKQATKGMQYGVIANKLLSRIYLGQKKEAYKTAEELCAVYDDGRESWFSAYHARIICCFWFKDYQQALELFLYTYHSKDYKRHEYMLSEKWNLLRAYLYFFYKQGLIDISHLKEMERRIFEKFSLSRFLNEMPLSEKDKRGYNISLLVIQMLILMQQGKIGKIIDKVEALGAYATVHLRRNQTYRSNCFIRMIVRAANRGFNKRVLEKDKYIIDLLEKMSSYPQKNPEVEIIPYEHQWELFLSLLDD